jgi:PAS domain S-box-containing protein
MEKRYIRKDGSIAWARTGVSAIRDTDGKLLNYVVLAEDVSARVEAEKALRRSEARLRTAAEHSTDIVVEVDLATCEAELFGACEEIFGVPVSDTAAFSRDWRSLIHPEDVDRLMSAMHESLADGSPLYLECRARGPKGSGPHVAIRGTRLVENPGKFLLMIADITERKRAEETASRLAAIVRSSENAIISASLDGSIQTWNRAAEKLYGYTADEMIGRSIIAVYRPEDVQEALDRLTWLRTGHFVNVDRAARRRKDGSTLVVSLRAAPLRDASGAIIGVCSISEDITARIAAEEQLRESEERFRRVFQHSPIGIALVGPDDAFLRVNSAFCDMLCTRKRNSSTCALLI